MLPRTTPQLLLRGEHNCPVYRLHSHLLLSDPWTTIGVEANAWRPEIGPTTKGEEIYLQKPISLSPNRIVKNTVVEEAITERRALGWSLFGNFVEHSKAIRVDLAKLQ